jgi:hypothetical protein
VVSGMIASLFALFGVLMPNGEKSSSRPSGICMVFIASTLFFTCLTVVWNFYLLIRHICVKTMLILCL